MHNKAIYKHNFPKPIPLPRTKLLLSSMVENRIMPNLIHYNHLLCTFQRLTFIHFSFKIHLGREFTLSTSDCKPSVSHCINLRYPNICFVHRIIFQTKRVTSKLTSRTFISQMTSLQFPASHRPFHSTYRANVAVLKQEAINKNLIHVCVETWPVAGKIKVVDESM